METLAVWVFPKIEYQFKSYYVVWKLDIPFFHNTYLPQFKSYYVVWKRIKFPA